MGPAQVMAAAWRDEARGASVGLREWLHHVDSRYQLNEFEWHFEEDLLESIYGGRRNDRVDSGVIYLNVMGIGISTRERTDWVL